MCDLALAAFKELRSRFFDCNGNSIAFSIEDKKNTQDDPFDRFIAEEILTNLAEGVTCIRAPGALTTPDMVLCRTDKLPAPTTSEQIDDLCIAIGIEVKKLERTASGKVARSSGMDYNSTPPCSFVRVYRETNNTLDIRAFYLFVCLEPVPCSNKSKITALALVDGMALNFDTELYFRITGQRKKGIGLGSYGDGADRQRPMVIFANPLGAPQFDKAVTLIHSRNDLENQDTSVRLVYKLKRIVPGKEQEESTQREFYCYRSARDAQTVGPVATLHDPFPSPKRKESTQGRGKFIIP
jgi:hypothetical protein